MSKDDIERVRTTPEVARRTLDFAMTLPTPREAALAMVRTAYVLAMKAGGERGIEAFDEDIAIIRAQAYGTRAILESAVAPEPTEPR